MVNIIGFFGRPKRYKWQNEDWQELEPERRYCTIHIGTELVPKKNQKGTYWCPICGSMQRK
jgi:hypothetical protein